MTQALSKPRQIVRAIHAGIAGVMFVLIPFMMLGDYELRDAMFRGNFARLAPLGTVLSLGFLFLGLALVVPRAKAFLLGVVALVDMPLSISFWEDPKGALLGPVLATSVLCIFIELARQINLRKRLAT